MKPPSLPIKRWPTLAIVSAIALGGLGVAHADVNNAPAWGLISQKGTSNPIYDTIQLTIGDPADPTVYNNLMYVDMDMQYNYPSYGEWESVIWRLHPSLAGRRLPASMIGTDNIANPIDGRYIQLRNLTINNADLDAQNVRFRFSPFSTPAGNTSLTLNNSSLKALNPPGGYADALFTLTATGDTTISGWGTGAFSSQSTLNVTPGSTLSFFRIGNTHGAGAWDTWYFDSPGNIATIDGGTLRLDQSYVAFGKYLATPAARMTFKNGASLELTGESAKLQSGDVSILNSSVKLGLGVTKLVVENSLALNGAQVDIASAAKLTTPSIDVSGVNTIALPQENGATDYSMATGVIVMNPDSRLTLSGQGTLATDLLLDWNTAGTGQQYGEIVVKDNASLVNTRGHFVVRSAARVTIQRTSDEVYGSVIAVNGGGIELRGLTGFTTPFTNVGMLAAYVDSWITVPSGTYTIQGGAQGVINIYEGGLMVGNFGTSLGANALLTTDNKISLDNFSTLQLTIDPTARKNSQVRTSSLLAITNFANLNLGLVNDQVLPIGTRFILMDYGSLTGTWGSATYFSGYRDRSSFVLGMNRYQINYRDAADPGYAGAITLTVVPMVASNASLSPTPQTLTGTVGTAITPSAALLPSNFGGTVTYSINPGLPSGLRFDQVTGIISGRPSLAMTATTFTIRGVGASAGDANALVNITAVKGGQTITFGGPATPTYAPSGGFMVSATATSGLPVSYSSSTPLVCASNSSAIQILSAGTCIIAANQAGDANFNAATQVTQTIPIAKAVQSSLTLFGTPSNVNVSQTSTLVISGGSGSGAVSFAVSGPCSVAGTTLTGNAAGTCSITATKASDTNYNAMSSNPITVQVGAGAQNSLVLTASPTSLSVNSTSTLSTTGGSGTGTVTFGISSGPCILVGGNTVKGMSSGQCQVFATKAADGSFAAATSNAVTLQFNLLAPPALVLSASPTSVGLGGSTTLNTSGGISGGALSFSIVGPCYLTGGTLTGTSAGTCTVTAAQAATSIYSAVTSNTLAVQVKVRTTTFSYPASTANVGRPFTLTPITSGFAQPTFALLYGSLPAWATLHPGTGVISGIPTVPVGTIDVAISVFENNAYDAALAVISVQDVPAAIPTLNEWGLIVLTMLIAGISVAMRRRLESQPPTR